MNDQSEEKKSDARIETEFQANTEEVKSIPPLMLKMKDPSKKNSNMIDYLLNFDNILQPNRSKQKQSIIVEEDDFRIDNSNPFDSSPVRDRRVIDHNLLELNEEQEGSGGGINQTSGVCSTSRNSFPRYVDNALEIKEGWLYKRSFKYPTFIGWQRRY